MTPLLLALGTAAAAPIELSLDGKIALGVVLLVFVGLVWLRRVPIELLFLTALVGVTLAGVINPREALQGFASPAVLFIAALFAAAAGLRSTGALDWVGTQVLGNAETEQSALRRLALTVVPVSAFVLNTPLVAMFLPVVLDWCRQRNVSPSRILLPLSYLTIVGGVCTLIGTSTTLVVNAKLSEMRNIMIEQGVADPPVQELAFFDITAVGVPIALAGAAYVLLIAPKLLPNRTELIQELGDRRREYLLEMLVQPECPLVGRTVQQAGLRNLPGLFLIEISRDEEIITPVTPADMIRAGDRMVFTGVVQTIADLERIPGLVPAADMTYEFHPAQRTLRRLTEAVLSRTSPLIGRSVREANFRQRYNAAIVAVHRNGERLTNKIGSIRLEPGDTLLLQTHAEFVEAYRNSRDFYLVSPVGETSARRHDRALVAGVLFAVMILWLTIAGVFGGDLELGNFFSNKPQAIIGFAIVVLMIGTRCLSTEEARSAIDLQVILTIAAAIGLGQALEKSGAASFIAHHLVDGTAAAGISEHWQAFVLLALIYLVTALFTEMISNVAVAAMMIPIAVEVALAGPDGGYATRPFVLAVALAASLSFATPIGYQTNLMVMGPGGYRPADYLRVGLPLTLVLWIAALLLIPLFAGFAHPV